MSVVNKYIPELAIILSGVALVSAWILEYGFGYLPCTMCYWQRYAHMLVIFIAVLMFLMRHYKNYHIPFMNIFLIFAFVVSSILAFWHTGVEFSWWDGPETCSTGSQNYDFDINNPLRGLDGMIRPPACSEAVWHFLGLSMAAWNTLISLTGVLMATLAIRRDLEK
jgi:disulfide bond formation protein DsbB